MLNREQGNTTALSPWKEKVVLYIKINSLNIFSLPLQLVVPQDILDELKILMNESRDEFYPG